MTNTDKLTHSIISAQIALNQLEAIKHTPFYKQSLKNKLNTTIAELIECERNNYDKLFNVAENATVDVYQVFDEFLKLVSTIPVHRMDEIGNLIKEKL